ncbi:MAG: glycosyltransferase family 29 protein [Sulfitobacter sp.]|uniref:glycosyltransferase family 29 protein n=1 Tax=Celeribacter marinus TaxID=1397108 RepID=UPI00316D691A
MNPWSIVAFRVRKTLFGDTFLRKLSLDKSGLLEVAEGKSCAIVGNARSLSGTSFGAEIDTNDIVIRLNDAPLPSSGSHGEKTDWIAVAKRVSMRNLTSREPTLLLWMPTKRKRLTWTMVSFAKFYLNETSRNKFLAEKLGAPPTVGFMVIDLLKGTKAKSIRLYGFDFFASQSLSGNRTAEQVSHDFSAEREEIMEVIACDPRFVLVSSEVQPAC